MADDTNKKKKHFFKDMKTELKKVTWLTPKQLLNNTTAVIVMVVIVAAIVFVLDFTFENINSHGVERLKSIVQQDETNTIDSTENNADSNTADESEDNNSTSEDVENNVSNETENNNDSNEVQE